MSRTLKLILAINVLVLVVLTFAYPHLMVGPGKLIAGHQSINGLFRLPHLTDGCAVDQVCGLP